MRSGPRRQEFGKVLGARAKVVGQFGLLIDVVVGEFRPRVLQPGANLDLAGHPIGHKWMAADVKPKIHMQRPVAALVRIIDVILNLEFSRHARQALLQQLGEAVDVLDIVADDTAADQVAARRKRCLGLPSLRGGFPLDT